MHDASDIDLVFLDPDNEIEVPSKPIGRKGASKYSAWQEIDELREAGCSLLIYQHFPREPRAAFAERMMSALRDRAEAPFIAALRTAHVLFLLAAEERHESWLRDALALLPARWGREIGTSLLTSQRP